MIAKISRGVLVSIVGLVIAASSAMADTGELINRLSLNLGVTQQQASGGAGSIFRLAKSRLQPGQFLEIAERIPGLNELIAGAPAPVARINGQPAAIENMNTAAGGAGSSAAGAQSTKERTGRIAGLPEADRANLGALTPLSAPFAELGMPDERIREFVPIVLEYTRSQAGDPAMRLMERALING
jgi:hypothetical protein